jgi:hypothetical protein
MRSSRLTQPESHAKAPYKMILVEPFAKVTSDAVLHGAGGRRHRGGLSPLSQGYNVEALRSISLHPLMSSKPRA